MGSSKRIVAARFLFYLSAAAMGCIAWSTAHAQSYPSRPVKLIVPYSPGGAVDLVGRTIAQRLSELMGQPVVVENRPGAGAMIGVDATVHAPADGYTLLVVDPALVINPSLQEKVGYDVIRDLKPVSMLTGSPLLLSVNAQLPIKDVTSLVAYAKNNPGGFNFASAGVGTTPHMAGELLKLRSGQPFVHVPYKGSGPAMADLVSGQVQFAFSSIAAAIPYVRDGRIRAIATSSLKRSALLPDVPTVAEAGIANFDVLFWTGLFVPAATPTDIVRRLNAEVQKALAQPETRAALDKVGETATYTSVEDAARYVRAEFDKWAQVVKDAKLKATQ